MGLLVGLPSQTIGLHEFLPQVSRLYVQGSLGEATLPNYFGLIGLGLGLLGPGGENYQLLCFAFSTSLTRFLRSSFDHSEVNPS